MEICNSNKIKTIGDENSV